MQHYSIQLMIQPEGQQEIATSLSRCRELDKTCLKHAELLESLEAAINDANLENPNCRRNPILTTNFGWINNKCHPFLVELRMV